ncbi:hypothetical protein D3C86_1825790 [compost metagenome]
MPAAAQRCAQNVADGLPQMLDAGNGLAGVAIHSDHLGYSFSSSNSSWAFRNLTASMSEPAISTRPFATGRLRRVSGRISCRDV